MAWEDPDLISDFLVEAEEHLDEADTALLSLEAKPDDPELRRRLNGSFHTLKGMASYVDFKEVEQLCHVTESLIGALSSSGATTSRRYVDLAFQAVTLMRQYFALVADCVEGDTPAPEPLAMRKLHARIASLVA
ncbi:MAG: Hpt domain-containing protein [Myxococcales bacterium]|nr:Hpt domain-containing protein [Myxococcales bacterium]MDD9966042.1 Hpt domain-containing protein [Myxococcales bacterium]